MAVVAAFMCANVGIASAQQGQGYTPASTRVALVVGNSAYEGVEPLLNAANDAEAIAEALWEAGFEVVESIDADRETMLANLATFRSRLRPGSEAVFFYAGHGVQIGGRNFLLPVSVTPHSVAELEAQSIDAQRIVDAMNTSGAALNVVIIDACRNNPFAQIDEEQVERIADRAITIGASEAEVAAGLAVLADAAPGGLAEMSAGSTETLIGFATAPGAVAFDGDGRHSPYTQSIFDNIDVIGLEIGQLFRRVRGQVRELTDGEQITWTTSTLESDFYFRPPVDDLRAATTGMRTATDTLGTLPPRRVVDRTFWRAIRDTDRLDAFVAYLRTSPDGAFVEEARRRIRELGGDPDATSVSDTSIPGHERPMRGVAALEAARADAREALERAETVVAIGTGETKLPLAEGEEVGRWVYVEESPRLGIAATSDGRLLTAKQVFWSDAVRTVDYTPLVGSNGGVDAVEVAILLEEGAIRELSRTVETFVHACDMLAGMPQDSQRATAGARQFIVNRNFDAAIIACELAVEDHPDVPRFWAQLARAYRAAGRYEEALDWQLKAVDADYLAAVVNLGQMYLDAQAVPRDYARAYELFTFAADREESAAYTALAWVYRAGVGVAQDYGQAMEWYRRGAADGNDWAMTNIAEMYQTGKGVDRDPQTAVEWYTRAANSGELTAQTRLARMYQRGDGIPVDYERARYWFETSAGRGVPNALTRLGIIYEDGQGVARDIEGAFRLYGRAAAEGDDEAVYRLGRLYASQTPLYDDPGLAVQLLEQALERGVHGVDRDLARLYEEGRGAPKDLVRALDLYEAAAETNPWAARDVGRLHAVGGAGLSQDFAKAAAWYEQAARAGVPWAARDLARLYESGRGVRQDRLEALIWYAEAVRLSDDPTLRRLIDDRLGAYSARDYVAAAQTLLNRLGAGLGSPDGVMGSRTRAALEAAFGDRASAPPADLGSIDALAEIAELE